MRIVTREEFLKMPEGTVYMVPFQEPARVGIYPGIYIKGETDHYNEDWWCVATENWKCDDCVAEFSLAFREAHHRDIPMDYETEQRHDDDRRWISKIAVLSDADVDALCRALKRRAHKGAE